MIDQRAKALVVLLPREAVPDRAIEAPANFLFNVVLLLTFEEHEVAGRGGFVEHVADIKLFTASRHQQWLFQLHGETQLLVLIYLVRVVNEFYFSSLRSFVRRVQQRDYLAAGVRDGILMMLVFDVNVW